MATRNLPWPDTPGSLKSLLLYWDRTLVGSQWSLLLPQQGPLPRATSQPSWPNTLVCAPVWIYWSGKPFTQLAFSSQKHHFQPVAPNLTGAIHFLNELSPGNKTRKPRVRSPVKVPKLSIPLPAANYATSSPTPATHSRGSQLASPPLLARQAFTPSTGKALGPPSGKQ